MNKKFNKEIPIFFSVDENYLPFLAVALRSILDNATEDNFYKVHVLNTGISEVGLLKFQEFNCENMDITFINVADRMEKINKDKIHLRDYYTKAIYYRIFIPAMFSNYKKVLYLDCDIVLLDDVAKLFNHELGDNILLAVHEETMTHVNVFGDYSEQFLGVKREKYFNSGVLLINVSEYIKENIEDKFIDFMHHHKFEVAPDQDYLNVLCKGRVMYASVAWNKTPFDDLEFDDGELKLIHYKLNLKPWHYFGVKYEEYFWSTAKKTDYYKQLLVMRKNYSNQMKIQDAQAFEKLQQTALDYINLQNNYKNFVIKKSDYEIRKKIKGFKSNQRI